MKLTQSRASMLRNLNNNGGSIMWQNIGGPGKTASYWLVMKGLAEMVEAHGATFQPGQRRLQITDVGRSALSVS